MIHQKAKGAVNMKQQNEFRWADIEPRCVLRTIVRNCWMVVLAALIAGMGAKLMLDWIWTPEYTSSITYTVMSKSASATSIANYNTANEVAVQYSSMLESELMQERICQALGVESLPGTISASVVGETNILQVSATSSSARTAFEMVRAVDAHYPELGQYIDQNAVLHVLTSAQAPTSPSNALNQRKLISTAALLAGVAMVAALGWFSIARDTVQTRAGARHKLDAEILAAIPHEKRGRGKLGKKERLLLRSPMVSFFFQEAFFRLRTSVEQAETEKNNTGRVLLVTSVTAGEGKSTVAANLALALAQKHRAVMLIDADLRNPTQVRLLGRKAMGKEGLSKLLQSGVSDAGRIAAAAAYDEATNLVTLVNDQPCRNAAELLSSESMARLVAAVRKTMDYIVIDSPPIGMFADGDMLADLADDALLVVRQDVVSAGDINDAADAIAQGKARFLGCVLNNMQSFSLFHRLSGYGYGSYGYGYHGYGYGNERSSQGASRNRARG